MEASTPAEERLSTIVAVLIAVVTVAAALIAWRASVADDAAGDATRDGLRALLNAEETRVLSTVDAYDHYRGFIAYTRHTAVGDQIVEDQGALGAEEAAALEEERVAAHDLAVISRELFPSRFVGRDGTYDVRREIGELEADARRERPLDWAANFADSSAQRQRSLGLLAAAAALAFGLVLYTLVESLGGRARYAMVAAGTLVSVGASVVALLIETGRL